MPYCIYHLVDPRNNDIRYVGMSKNPERRYKEHVSGLYSTPQMLKWLNELAIAGIEMEMVVVEMVGDVDEAREREMRLIQEYRDKNIPLLNVLVGQGYNMIQMPVYVSDELQDKLDDLVYMYNKQHRGKKANRQDIMRHLLSRANIQQLQDMDVDS